MANEDYSAAQLTVLEGLEAVRKRPGMYIGSTDSKGLMHCLWEIIDNSVDEALAGYCKNITVTLRDDDSVEVEDDGRGIPVDIEKKTGLTGVEVVMTKLHAGGKFGGGSYGAAGGLHGVGASVVNALSKRLDVQVLRDATIYSMSFSRGKPGVFEGDSPITADPASSNYRPSPEQKFTVAKKAGDLHEKKTDHSKLKTGTRIRYWIDRDIFPESEKFDYDKLMKRVRQTAFLVPNLNIKIVDKCGYSDQETQEFCYSGGVVDFVEHISLGEPVTDVWNIHEHRYFNELVQKLDEESSSLQSVEIKRDLEIDIAFRWNNGYDTDLRTFVNIVETPGGGTHKAGFEAALLKSFKTLIAENARKLKLSTKEINDLKIDKDDILAGLTCVIKVSFPEPQFEGQTKEILGTPQIKPEVQACVIENINRIFTSTKREYKAQSALVLEKVVGEMHARIQARKQKEITRRKNALETSSLPPKLSDCATNDVEHSELFIVEGDSALGTAKLARNSNFQALMPIRGKILNVQKVSVSQMLANFECSSIIQVVGAGSGRTFDIDQARYSKVVFMTDADVDGAHIRILLLTLFYRYMRPMIEHGRVYAAVPPLHRIALKGPKKGEYIYTYSEEQMLSSLDDLRAKKTPFSDDIQRYKGLGEMDADQLAETTMDPAVRTLRRINLEDAEEAERIFELLMGSEVAPRKDFIVANSDRLDFEAIDL
jgi:DNA gyrase subunit B